MSEAKPKVGVVPSGVDNPNPIPVASPDSHRDCGVDQETDVDYALRWQAESQWRQSEFTALRQEFIERFRTENLLVLGALTFLGTIAGIAFGGQHNLDILLIVPIVIPLIGIFYLNQRISNTSIGLYVKDHLTRRINTMLKAEVLEWEEYVRRTASRKKELTIFTFVLLIFGAPCIAVLAFTFSGAAFQPAARTHYVWWLGCGFSLAWLILWVSEFDAWRGT
jgi:hypothetical protein